MADQRDEGYADKFADGGFCEASALYGFHEGRLVPLAWITYPSPGADGSRKINIDIKFDGVLKDPDVLADRIRDNVAQHLAR